MAEYVPGAGESVATRQRNETKLPKRYRVLLHNDDYTTMEFVVEVLTGVFRKPKAEAVRIMYEVHRGGTGMCGVYTGQIAETKVAAVHKLARECGFPLRCSMEPE
ncbi:MAG: ATP-dependent Clp protease adaptor ClpS [Nitrospiraceae bacterium]|nr:ATP-dependent Clp protease adaptor ClpS [Nitrospiraceae bacterium]